MSWLKRLGHGIAGALPGYDMYRGLGHAAGGIKNLAEDVFSSAHDIIQDPLGRGFAASEAEKARAHAEYMQSLAHGFSSDEALKAREHASGEAKLARNFNSNEAIAARTHQIHMAKNQTAYQVQGMRAAGINPILAAQFGGAVPPPGPAASSSAPSSAQAHGVGGGGQGASSPISAVRDVIGLVKLGAEVANIGASTRQMNTQADDLEQTRSDRLRVMIEDAAQKRITGWRELATIDEIDERILAIRKEHPTRDAKAIIDTLMAKHAQGAGGSIERWSKSLGIEVGDLVRVLEAWLLRGSPLRGR